MSPEEQQKNARLALVLLERVELKGKEVQAYISVNQFLGKVADGTLVFTPAKVSPPPEG